MLASAGSSLADTARLATADVSAVVLAVDGVMGLHDVRTRGAESDVYVDLHIQVDPQVTVAEGHAIAEKVEHAVADSFAEVRDVIAHLEPFDDYQQRKTAEQEQDGRL